MPLDEIGYGTQELAAVDKNRLAAEQTALFKSKNDYRALGQSVEQQWPDVPAMAVSYLAANCKNGLSLALAEARKVLAEDPHAFADPDLASLLLDDCIANTQIARTDQRTAKDRTRMEQAESEGGNLDSTIGALKEQISGNLTGTNKLGQIDKLILDLNHAGDIDAKAKAAALKRLQSIRSTLVAMSSAMVSQQSQAAFERIVASSDIDLGASSLTMTFSPLMAAVESSAEISKDEKVQLRQLVGYRPRDLETGRDVRRAALATVTDPVTGEETPIHTRENKAPIVPGVTTYTNNGRDIILEVKTGKRILRLDVTGQSDEMIGLKAEALGFWAGTEALGATSFVEDVYKVDFSILNSGAFDPLKMIEIRQKISYMVGGFEGYDGDIFDPRDKQGLLRAQMRVISETGTAFGWENDRDATKLSVKKLGLDNLDVLKEFGNYTQLHYLSGDVTNEKLQAHLHRSFPNIVFARDNGMEPH